VVNFSFGDIETLPFEVLSDEEVYVVPIKIMIPFFNIQGQIWMIQHSLKA